MPDPAVLSHGEPAKEDGRLLRGEATRERVLDAAERLFSDQGFDAVSIRQIAQEAGVTLGVVGFHGGSKLDLFTTILSRRVATLSAARRASLAELQRGGRVPGVKELMRAYILPYMEIAGSGDPQWRAYARLIALMVNDERWYRSVRDLYDPVAREYLDALKTALPGADPERLAAAFVMSVAAMLSTVASTIRMVALATHDEVTPVSARPPMATYADPLIAFCAGGIERSAVRSDRSGPKGQT